MKSTKNLNIAVILFAVFALLGFADATFLTVEHYLGNPIPCSIFGGCDVVTNSAYSHIGPIPIALIGSLYYLLLIILSIVYLDSKSEKALKAGIYLTVVAFIASLYLVYLQIFVIHALCLYCMISAALSLILFSKGQYILFSLRKTKTETSAEII